MTSDSQKTLVDLVWQIQIHELNTLIKSLITFSIKEFIKGRGAVSSVYSGTVQMQQYLNAVYNDIVTKLQSNGCCRTWRASLADYDMLQQWGRDVEKEEQ